jgi:PKD repeat protein
MQRLSALFLVSALAVPATSQFTVVIPDGFATTAENGGNAFPFASAIAPTWTGLRIQHVYDSTNFTNQGVTFPVLISTLRWRAQNGANTITWAGGTYSQSTIQMSTAAVDFLATTTNYAGNHGANLTTVHTGPVVVQPGTLNGAGVPGPYHIEVQLASPFLYDPNQGDLCIDVDVPGTSWGGGSLRTLASVTAAGVPTPQARRVFASSMYPNANGVDQNILVMQLEYLPAAGLYSGFSANVTSGPNPLAVQFTDNTYTSDPNGVTSWAWDLNGDGITDSNQQNPTFTYSSCGSFNVSLTTTDGTHAPSTLTRTAYINTDTISAAFTQQPLAPQVVQFTDTSNMPATAWAWDLNGDGIIDSNAQNPVFAYPNNNPVNVTLTVTRNCRTSTVTRTIVPLPDLTTLFTGGNNGASLWTVYFDVNVTNPRGISLESLAVNTTSGANVPFTLDLFIKTGSYVGFGSLPSAWRALGTATGTSAAVNQPSFATLASPAYLPQGNYGLAIRYSGIAPSYTNGNGTNQAYSNADLSLSLGAAQATTTAPFTGGTPFTPRVWNGSLYYDTFTLSSAAGYGFLGEGCPGSLGVSTLSGTTPLLGTTLSVTVNNLPTSSMIMLTGFSKTMSLFGPLPLSIASFGAPGCQALVSTEVTLFLFGGGNSATWNLNIPNSGAFSGLQLYNQALVFDPGFNALGAVLSDAAACLIGN